MTQQSDSDYTPDRPVNASNFREAMEALKKAHASAQFDGALFLGEEVSATGDTLSSLVLLDADKMKNESESENLEEGTFVPQDIRVIGFEIPVRVGDIIAKAEVSLKIEHLHHSEGTELTEAQRAGILVGWSYFGFPDLLGALKAAAEQAEIDALSYLHTHHGNADEADSSE